MPAALHAEPAAAGAACSLGGVRGKSLCTGGIPWNRDAAARRAAGVQRATLACILFTYLWRPRLPWPRPQELVVADKYGCMPPKLSLRQAPVHAP